MSTVIKLASGTLTGTLATIYTAPGNVVIKAFNVANESGGPVSLKVTLAGVTVLPLKSISDVATYQCPECINQLLESGAVIQAIGLDLDYYITGVLL